jgi:uncharacterized protein (TIGR01589 family)
VQNLIERCLQLYMTRDEVVSILRAQATVEPGFTALVWQKLEEQNPEFFRCYYTRLKLKAQVVMFNHLLEQQVGVVQRMQRGWTGGGGGGGGAAGAAGAAAAGGSTSATASGIPLFHGGGARGGTPGGGHPPATSAQQQQAQGGGGPHHAGLGKQPGGGGGGGARQAPGGAAPAGGSAGGDSGGDFGFQMAQAMDGVGVSPLFAAMPHIVGEDAELGHLGQTLPTPSELHHHGLAFLPQPSPLNTQGGAATLPRNFSLSDLGMGMGMDGGGEEGGAPPPLGLSLPRNFSLSELDGAGRGSEG